MVMSGETWPRSFIKAGKLTPERSISSRVGVSKLVRHDASGEAEAMTDLVQVIAELADQRFLGGWARQQETIGGQRIQGAKEAQALDEFTDKRIHWDHPFGFEFAERDMNGPLIRAGGAKAIARQIGTLADAHAGVTNQQKRIAAEIIAAEELLLEELVLFCGEGRGSRCGRRGMSSGADQMSEIRKLIGSKPVRGRCSADESAG